MKANPFGIQVALGRGFASPVKKSGGSTISTGKASGFDLGKTGSGPKTTLKSTNVSTKPANPGLKGGITTEKGTLNKGIQGAVVVKGKSVLGTTTPSRIMNTPSPNLKPVKAKGIAK